MRNMNRFFKKLAGLVGLSFFLLAASHGVDDRIVEDDPSSADLEYLGFSIVGRFDFIECTGFLISPQVVATARHCFLSANLQDLEVDPETGVTLNNGGYFRLKLVNGVEVAKSKPLRVKYPKREVVLTDASGGGEKVDAYDYTSDWALIELETPLPLPENLRIELVSEVPRLPLTVSMISYPVALHLFSAEVEFDPAYAKMDGFSPVWSKRCSLFQRGEEGRLLLHDCPSSLGASGAPLLRVVREPLGEGFEDVVQIFGINVGDPASGENFKTISLPAKNADGKAVDPGNANLALSVSPLSTTAVKEELMTVNLSSPTDELFPREQIVQNRNGMKEDKLPETSEPAAELASFAQEVSNLIVNTLGAGHKIITITKDDGEPNDGLVYGFQLDDVPNDSAAASTGLMAGDIIVQFDGFWIDSFNTPIHNFLNNLALNVVENEAHTIIFVRPFPENRGSLAWTTSMMRTLQFGTNESFLIGLRQ